MPSPNDAVRNPMADWFDSYPPWSGLSQPHPKVAQAAYAYLQECNLKAAVEILLGKGPYESNQISRVRHSMAFWREVMAQIGQRRMAALTRAAAGCSDNATIRAAAAAGELEGLVGKWLTRLEEVRAARRGAAPASGAPVEAEW